MADLKNSRTSANLKLAFASKSQANRRFLSFAQMADAEGYPSIATLFRSIAESATREAFSLFDFLESIGDPVTGEKVGSTADNLRSVIAGEAYEYIETYPGFAKIAREEGFEEIAEWLETLTRTARSHATRCTDGLDSLNG